VAVDLPEPLRRLIWEKIITPLKGIPAKVSYVREESLHITLKFMGDVEEADLKRLYELLTSSICGFGEIFLMTEKTGYFGARNFPQVLWLGLTGDTGRLALLAEKIESATKKLGVGREKKKFLPHITIGRVKSAQNANFLIAKLEESTIQPFQFVVDRVFIKQSILKPQGALYNNLYEIPLKGGSDEK